MNSGVTGLLGLCRRAGKLAMGHDACKSAVNSGKAKLCLVCSDSSQRVYDEFVNLCENHKIPVFRISPTLNELHRTIGYKAGIITVNDQGFASSVMKKLTTENEPGEEHDI